MALTNPLSLLIDENGNTLPLSQSQLVANSHNGILTMGSGSSGARFFKISSDGDLFVTGTLSTTTAGVQEVTGSVSIDNSSLSVDQGSSGSIANSWFVTLTDGANVIGDSISTPVWVSGSVEVLNDVNVTISGVTPDNGKLPVTGTLSTRQECAFNSSVTLVTSSTASITVLPSNSNRLGAMFYKEGNGIAYVKLGISASATSFTAKVQRDGYFELPVNYCGDVTVTFDSAAPNSNLLVTEILY